MPFVVFVFVNFKVVSTGANVAYSLNVTRQKEGPSYFCPQLYISSPPLVDVMMTSFCYWLTWNKYINESGYPHVGYEFIRWKQGHIIGPTLRRNPGAILKLLSFGATYYMRDIRCTMSLLLPEHRCQRSVHAAPELPAHSAAVRPCIHESLYGAGIYCTGTSWSWWTGRLCKFTNAAEKLSKLSR